MMTRVKDFFKSLGEWHPPDGGFTWGDFLCVVAILIVVIVVVLKWTLL